MVLNIPCRRERFAAEMDAIFIQYVQMSNCRVAFLLLQNDTIKRLWTAQNLAVYFADFCILWDCSRIEDKCNIRKCIKDVCNEGKVTVFCVLDYCNSISVQKTTFLTPLQC